MSVERNNYFAMMKSGKYRAFRNLPVGWVLQIIHSTDKTERYYRVLVELAFILILFVSMLYATDLPLGYNLLISFLVIHTISWFFVGNFWVYMLDSLLWVNNGGIDKSLKYIKLVQKLYSFTNSDEAVLIYGSMCRNMFHNRSDIDLRVIRKKGFWNAFWALSTAAVLKTYAFFIMCPVDFQVVDSISFLQKQMRDDEFPIVAHASPDYVVPNAGLSLSEVLSNPTVVCKDKV